jgi:hypothetical protein
MEMVEVVGYFEKQLPAKCLLVGLPGMLFSGTKEFYGLFFHNKVGACISLVDFFKLLFCWLWMQPSLLICKGRTMKGCS